MADSITTPTEGDRPAFELFPKLPIELRLKIFRMAASEPRIVELGYDHVQGRVVQQQLMPPLFATCRESREELLRGARLLLCDKVNNKRDSQRKWLMPSLLASKRGPSEDAPNSYKLLPGSTVDNQKVFMNFEVDTLYIPERPHEILSRDAPFHDTYHLLRIVDQLSEETLQSIKYLAIDYTVISDMYSREPDFASLLKFRNLEKLGAVFSVPGGKDRDYSTEPRTESYRFKSFEKALKSIERDIHHLSTLQRQAVEEMHPILDEPRNCIRDLAASEHNDCASTCSHTDKWKVPEVAMVFKVPVKPLKEENINVFREKGLCVRLMEKCWTKLIRVYSGIFGRSG